MADDANPFDWRKNLPPIATIFPQLGVPSMAPFGETGMPYPTPDPTPLRPYTMPKVNPPLGPGSAPNITAPGQTGIKFDSGVPLGDFTNPSPTQPAEDPDAKFKRQLQEYMKSKDFSGALGAIGKGMTRPKAPITTQPFHVSAPTHMSQGKDLSGAGGGFMSKAMEELAKYNLMAGRKPGEQGRYDILNKRQSSLKDLLAQLG